MEQLAEVSNLKILSKVWSDKNQKKFEEIKLNDTEKYIFKCQNCGHDEAYMLNPNEFLNLTRTNCKYCSSYNKGGIKEFCQNLDCRYINTLHFLITKDLLPLNSVFSENANQWKNR